MTFYRKHELQAIVKKLDDSVVPDLIRRVKDLELKDTLEKNPVLTYSSETGMPTRNRYHTHAYGCNTYDSPENWLRTMYRDQNPADYIKQNILYILQELKFARECREKENKKRKKRGK